MKWIVEAESIDDIVLGRYVINLDPLTECKDCKFYTSMIPTEGVGICSLAGRHLGDDGFCSEAERREDGSD